MQELFCYISPDPQADGEDFPPSPFWHTVDILAIARRVLRRRSAEEVYERAERLRTKLKAYQADIEEMVAALPEDDARFFRSRQQDDAGDLEFLLTPNSSLPFRRTAKEDATDAPWVAETGWFPAEDQAILALLKVDAAAGHLVAGGDDSLATAGTCLLDAYRGCVIAIQDGGLHIQTKDEADGLADRMAVMKEQHAKYKKQAANFARRTQLLKLLIETRYRQLREQNPQIVSKAEFARMVAYEYDAPTDFFRELAGALSVKEEKGITSFERIYEWILDSDKPPAATISPPDEEDIDSLRSFEKALRASRKKNRP